METLKIQAITNLQSDLLAFSHTISTAPYYVDKTVYKTNGLQFSSATTSCASTATTSTCDYPQIQMLIILVNENDDCTSSMKCKDGMKAIIDTIATSSCTETSSVCSSNYSLAVKALWDTTTTIDQSVSSGTTTTSDTTETIDRIYSGSNTALTEDLCTELWDVSLYDTGAKACV